MNISPDIAQENSFCSTKISLRQVEPGDNQFLLDVYADHRKDELDQAAWEGDQRQAFLSQQFQAQLAHYQSNYPNADHDIIFLDKTAIGRIYVNRDDEEIRLLDISLLNQYRNRGIGTIIMLSIISEADKFTKPLKLYVYKMNRAVRFYEKLGFKCVEDTGVHYLMERIPAYCVKNFTESKIKSEDTL